MGMRSIAQKYQIPAKGVISKWVLQYKKYGAEGLVVQSGRRIYGGSFKVSVLNWLKQHRASLTETALNFGISEPSTVWLWQRKFESGGIDALFGREGRTSTMTPKKKSTKKKITSSQSELAKLREENELLKIENEYLKKLRALVQSQPNNEHKSSKN